MDVGRSLSQYLSWLSTWRQGEGIYGGLHIHPCWRVSSVLERRYQGPTVSEYCGLIRGFLNLYEKTGEDRFLRECILMADFLRSLQDPDGCFEHSVYEFEPGRGGCIHNALADVGLLSLCFVLAEEELDPEPYLETVRRNFDWFMKSWWKRGNSWLKNPSFPCWCGVTNQDLAVCWAMLLYAELKDSRYWENYGRLVADWYLENYYLPEYGCFYRGDAKDFPEPAAYTGLIVYELLNMYQFTKDSLYLKTALGCLDYLKRGAWRDNYGFLRIHHNIDLETGVLEEKPSLITQGPLISGLQLLEEIDVQEYTSFKKELLKTLLFYQSGRGYFRNSTDHENLFDIVARICPGELEALTLVWRGGKLPVVEEKYDVGIDFSGGYFWIDSDSYWELYYRDSVVSGVKREPNGIKSGSLLKNVKRLEFREDSIYLELSKPISVSLDYVIDEETSVLVKCPRGTRIRVKRSSGEVAEYELEGGESEVL